MSPYVNPGQRSAGAGTCFHWLGGKADCPDADRFQRQRMKRAQPVGCEVGQLTISVYCSTVCAYRGSPHCARLEELIAEGVLCAINLSL